LLYLLTAIFSTFYLVATAVIIFFLDKNCAGYIENIAEVCLISSVIGSALAWTLYVLLFWDVKTQSALSNTWFGIYATLILLIVATMGYLTLVEFKNAAMFVGYNIDNEIEATCVDTFYWVEYGSLILIFGSVILIFVPLIRWCKECCCPPADANVKNI